MIQLVYRGDMDNNTFGPNGEVFPEQKWLGIIGRREGVTLLIYVWTLFPAIIIDDLGPVLSLTGSVGASCLAYIAPGMVYIGINGTGFLRFCDELLQRKGYPPYTSNAVNMDLPILGNAEARLETKEADKPKRPWWWYLCGFPFWVQVAQTGSDGVLDFIEETQSPEFHRDIENEPEGCTRDFWISIVLVIFGILALIVGVACNVYVQVHKVFYSPS
jgi:Transmembrane amino acid transporter protein